MSGNLKFEISNLTFDNPSLQPEKARDSDGQVLCRCIHACPRWRSQPVRPGVVLARSECCI